MEIFLKYVAVGLITIMMQIVFSVCWHFGVKTIFENHSEDNATQIYVFLKYFSLLLVAALFALILLWISRKYSTNEQKPIAYEVNPDRRFREGL